MLWIGDVQIEVGKDGTPRHIRTSTKVGLRNYCGVRVSTRRGSTTYKSIMDNITLECPVCEERRQQLLSFWNRSANKEESGR